MKEINRRIYLHFKIYKPRRGFGLQKYWKVRADFEEKLKRRRFKLKK